MLEPVPEAAGEEPNDLAAGWASFEALRDEAGDGTPSIDELISRTRPEPVPVTAASTEIEAAPVAEEAPTISITELCYKGAAALTEAQRVRDRIRSELAVPNWDAAEITKLIDELLDLVELSVGQN